MVHSLYSMACASSPDDERIEPVYDRETGRLQRLNYDANKNGKVDTVSYMDGARVVRVEIDQDEDGSIERWEYYGADQKLEKVGFSRANDGKEDGWLWIAPDGSTLRIEISTHRDGKVTRTEYYEKDTIVRGEEDEDADGRTDKWETYDGAGHLASVAFDTRHRGVPDRRLIYGVDGAGRLELDADGDGQFVPVKR